MHDENDEESSDDGQKERRLYLKLREKKALMSGTKSRIKILEISKIFR